jgi:hypothetical protein
MKLPAIAATTALSALVVISQSADAYSVNTYRGTGASRIEACASARQDALSSAQETAHGKLTRVGSCQCNRKDPAGHLNHWECWVQSIHTR